MAKIRVVFKDESDETTYFDNRELRHVPREGETIKFRWDGEYLVTKVVWNLEGTYDAETVTLHIKAER